MFFHFALLQPQHKLQLNLPWTAATLGIKTIKRKKNGNKRIEDFNICETSDIAEKFMKSESNNPAKRFSLRLSSYIIHGLILIWREQVILVEIETKKLLDYMTLESRLLDKDKDSAALTAGIKKAKVETRKARVTQELLSKERFDDFQINLDDLARNITEVQTVAYKDITLQEEIDIPIAQPQEGDFGILGLEEEMRPVTAEKRPSLPRIEVAMEAEVPEELITAPTEQPLPAEELDKLPETAPLAVVAVDKQEEAPPKDISHISPLPREEKIKETADIVMATSVLTKSRRKKTAAVLVKRDAPKAYVPIMRSSRDVFEDEVDHGDKINRIVAKPEVQRLLRSVLLMKKLWLEEELEEPFLAPADVARDARSSAVVGTSGSLHLVSPQTSASTIPSLLDIPSAGPTFASTPTKRSQLPGEILTESEAAKKQARESVQPEREEPPLPIIEFEQQSSIHEEQMPLVEPSRQEVITEKQQEKASPTSIAASQQDIGTDWLRSIMAVVKEQVQISAKDICRELSKQLTKRHMSIVFSNILVLNKMGYLTMHPKDSIKLEYVLLVQSGEHGNI